MSPLLWVDASGSRFVNEDVVYDTAFWANAAYAAGGKYYFIIDRATLEDYTAGTSIRISKAGPGANMEAGDFVALAEEAVAAGTAFKGSTVAELAEAAGMEVADLETTISRYNEMVKNQKDTDYNKSTASLKYPVGTGDYYAFDCRAVNLGTVGGIKVNEKLEVINIDYDPIKGLYAGGTNAGGYYEGQGYPPYEGLASGFAWTSGRIAGESASAYAATK
jgi:fumarate reductase flavoprotein subunit